MRVFRCTIQLPVSQLTRFEQRLLKTPGVPHAYLSESPLTIIEGIRKDTIAQLTFMLSDKDQGAILEQLLKDILNSGAMAYIDYNSVDGKLIIGG